MKIHCPLVRRFRNFTDLTAEDEALLASLTNVRTQIASPRRDVIREGERPRGVYLILSGWACRYKMLADGRRQVLAFLLPGDLCDIHNVVLHEMDHSIGALTELRYAELSHRRIEELGNASPRLRHAFWWHSMTAIAVQREWTTNIGQRNSFERLSHVLCELFMRMDAVGLVEGQSCEMPVTQIDLAEAVGLTSVHVNRTIQDIREAGLIVLKNRTLTIPDLPALQHIAMFSPNYLHLSRNRSAPFLGDDDSWEG